MPDHQAHRSIVGGEERVFLVPEVLVEGAPRYPRPGTDPSPAQLRVATPGCGPGDRGQDAFPLVGGDEAAHQPVPAAGQLIRPAPGVTRALGLAAACPRWLSHCHPLRSRGRRWLPAAFPRAFIVYDIVPGNWDLNACAHVSAVQGID